MNTYLLARGHHTSNCWAFCLLFTVLLCCRLAYPVYLLKRLQEIHEGNKLQIIYDIGCVMTRHLQVIEL